MPRRPDMWSDDPMPCDKCGQPHTTRTGTPSCTAHKRDGSPCTEYPMHGQKVGRMHGGAAQQNRAAGERRQGEQQARRALEAFGAPAKDVGDPGPVLVGLIEVSAGLMDFYREQVRQLEPEALVWGVVEEADEDLITRAIDTSEDSDDVDVIEVAGKPVARKQKRKAAKSVWLTLFDEERDRLASLAVAALKAGVQERQIQLAEQQGQVVGSVIRQILDALLAVVLALVARIAPEGGWEAAFTAEWGKAVGEVVPQHLRLLTAGAA